MVSIGSCAATGDIAMIRRSLGCFGAIWDTVRQARHLNGGWACNGDLALARRNVHCGRRGPLSVAQGLPSA